MRMVVEPEQPQGRAAYVVTDCAQKPVPQEPIFGPARLDWGEVAKLAHYSMSVVSLTN